MARGRASALLVLVALAGCRRAAAPPAAPRPAEISASPPPAAPASSAAPPVGAPTSTPPPPPPPDAAGRAAHEVDDDDDGMDAAPSRASPAPTSPLLALSDEELVRRYRRDKTSVGSLSVGKPNLGLLINGVRMGESPAWFLLEPSGAYGTEEVVAAIALAIGRAHEEFPETKPLPIGHIGAAHGGPLSPHKSHQSGRDVDLGYFLTHGQRGLVAANKSNLDAGPTWVMVKTALVETPVEMIFMDSAVQRLLVEHALAHGESPAFLDEVFLVRGKNPAAPIRHLHGHHNHLHIRFHSPNAEALARRLSRVLPTPRPAPPKGHGRSAAPAPAAGGFELRARSGDTLVVWAKRYGVSVEDIQRANGMSDHALKIGHVYRIPKPALPPLPPPKR
ncbi:MAG: penicillin-insensitive murein endopeptidase [Polyangiaceae bacterium]|nr:penicillin-insensitive murein endopeptidase [Polyangiaceae bacterium]